MAWACAGVDVPEQRTRYAGQWHANVHNRKLQHKCHDSTSTALRGSARGRGRSVALCINRANRLHPLGSDTLPHFCCHQWRQLSLITQPRH